MLALHRGQGRELLWRDHLRCPTEEEYVEMVKDSKYLAATNESSYPLIRCLETGGLLRIAVRLMVECATMNTGM